MSAQELPEPSFEVLVQVVAGPCFVHLGLAANPATGKVEKDLEQARWCLDLLHVLEKKAGPGLEEREREMIGALLHHLRGVYMKESG